LADEEVAALVASAFRFYAAPGEELRARAIAPTYVTEGWDASVSVVEAVMPDRPLIVDTIQAALEAEGLERRALLHPTLAAERDRLARSGAGAGADARAAADFLHWLVVGSFVFLG